MELVGYRQSSFVTRDTGEVISGYNLYLTGKSEKVEGLVAERVFLSEKKLAGYLPRLGDQLEIIYNRFGRVQELRLV